MNQAHLHLLLNHAPVMGALFGLLLLVIGFLRKSSEFKLAALVLFVVAAALTGPVMRTGEEAEHIIEELKVADEEIVEEHEEAAEFVLPVMILLGVTSLIALVVYRRKGLFPMWLQIVILLLAIVASGTISRTAWLGGHIRHPEIRSDAEVPSGVAEEEPH